MIRLPSVLKFISFTGAQNACATRQIYTQPHPLQFKISPALWGEPLKKKRKIDPAILRAREERKKKRIMKEIRRLQKLDKQLKPIADLEIPRCLVNEPEKRTRKISVDEKKVEERILILKEWARLKLAESNSDEKILGKLMRSQQEALDELRLVSEDLYQAAVKIDENLIPLKYAGPTETPAKEDYFIPDGEYIDTSKKWL